MSEPAIQSINQHTQKTSLDWLYNILIQPSSGDGSGVSPATHEQFGLSLDLLRQALVEVDNVVNVLTTTVPGKVLDARQGKVLSDAIAAEIAKYAQPNGLATLGADGKIPSAQIPSIALVDVFTVASEAEMLASGAEQGDMAIRSDTSQVFVLSASPATTIENWIELSALKALVDAAIADLAGTGRTTETVKKNADDIAAIKGTGWTNENLVDLQNTKVKLTKMPDGSGVVYSKDFANTSSIPPEIKASNGSQLAIVDDELVATWVTGAGRFDITYNFGLPSEVKKLCIRMRKTGGVIGIRPYLDGPNGYASPEVLMVTTDTNMYIFDLTHLNDVPITNIRIYFELGTLPGSSFCFSGISVGEYAYLPNSLATEASRIANQLGDTAGAGTKASGTITSNGTNVSDGDTVTIAGKVYTFKTILGTTEGNVLIGGTAAESLDNLKLAVNSTGVTAQQYCATFHPLVEATTNTDTVQTLQARTTSILGNSITLAKSASTLTISGPTLTGGTDDVGQKVYTQVKDIIAGGTRPAQADISDTSTIVGYENSVDVATGGTTTLPAGGTFRWAVYGYGATIGSAKKGTSAGGTVLTVAGANATVWYRRIA